MCDFYYKLLSALTVKIKKCLFSFIKVRSTYVKKCASTVAHSMQLYIKKEIIIYTQLRNHIINRTWKSSKYPKSKHHQNGSYGHQVHITATSFRVWNAVQTTTSTTSIVIWIPIRICIKPSVVISPLAIFICSTPPTQNIYILYMPLFHCMHVSTSRSMTFFNTFLTLCIRTPCYQNLGRYVITAYMFEH